MIRRRTVWQEASRLAAWAPDDARELLVAAQQDGDPFDSARLGELLGRVFAVTGAWGYARGAMNVAAAAWHEADRARAAAVRGVAAMFPLAPFPDDASALAAELDLVARSLDPAEPAPVARRAVVELRRALAPRTIVGRLEAALGLSPFEVGFVMAAAAHVLDPQLPTLTRAVWEPLLASSSLTAQTDLARLVRIGALTEAPHLAPAPGLVSWLLGRTAIEHAAGAVLRRVPARAPGTNAAELARDLVVGEGIAVAVGRPGSGRRTAIASTLGARGLSVFALQLAPGARRAAITAAALEARLHGGIAAIDLDAWDEPDLELVAELAPIAVVAAHEPAIPDELRAFTLTSEAVS